MKNSNSYLEVEIHGNMGILMLCILITRQMNSNMARLIRRTRDRKR